MDREAKRKLYAAMGYTEAEIVSALAMDERVERMRGCALGAFPWDEWHARARAAGVSEELATLGRSVVREFYNHAWAEELRHACGYDDDGAAMIALARTRPELAALQWQRLLDSDGLRGEWMNGTWRTWAPDERAAELRAFVPTIAPGVRR